MAVQIPGDLYHVMSRGDQRDDTSVDDAGNGNDVTFFPNNGTANTDCVGIRHCYPQRKKQCHVKLGYETKMFTDFNANHLWWSHRLFIDGFLMAAPLIWLGTQLEPLNWIRSGNLVFLWSRSERAFGKVRSGDLLPTRTNVHS